MWRLAARLLPANRSEEIANVVSQNLIPLTVAAITLPALHAAPHCLGNVASLNLRVVQSSLIRDADDLDWGRSHSARGWPVANMAFQRVFINPVARFAALDPL